MGLLIQLRRQLLLLSAQQGLPPHYVLLDVPPTLSGAESGFYARFAIDSAGVTHGAVAASRSGRRPRVTVSPTPKLVQIARLDFRSALLARAEGYDDRLCDPGWAHGAPTDSLAS